MNFDRLRAFLIAAFMIVSLVPLGSLGYKIISQGKTLIKEKSSSYLKALARRNSETISGFMLERINDMSTLSNIICSFGFDTPVLKLHFEQMKDHYAPYLAFSVWNQSGERVFSSLNAAISPESLRQIGEEEKSWIE